ncbi:MAG: hypothetical protein OES69_10925 [Myxococcales bacterium]|nr:hypothetical protein [Myxococcales bacterium]MDH3844442.1 hypothetical protein [Myxococcales bacterium]
MRFLVALVLTGALAVVGCGDDETNGTGGDGGGTAGTGGAGATGGTGGTGGGTGGSGGGTSASPVIENIAWETGAGCQQFTASDYTVTVTATDADNDVSELTYSGSVTTCTPGITADESTINCPNNALYAGTVTVEDPQGNTASASFSIDVCESSSCDGNPSVACSL